MLSSSRDLQRFSPSEMPLVQAWTADREDEARVNTIWASDLKGPYQLNDAWLVVSSKILEQLFLDDVCAGNLCAEDFQCIIVIVYNRLNEPNSSKAAETKLVDHDELIDLVTDLDWVIAPGHVFLDIFNLALIHVRRTIPKFGLLETFGTTLNYFSQRCRRGGTAWRRRRRRRRRWRW